MNDEIIYKLNINNNQIYYIIILGLSLSSSCPGLLVTSANDGIIKVWDIIENTKPSVIWEKKTNLGGLLCLASNPDEPFVFSAGGDNKSHNLKIFDLSRISESMLIYIILFFVNMYIIYTCIISFYF